jgi:hypothetical protein
MPIQTICRGRVKRTIGEEYFYDDDPECPTVATAFYATDDYGAVGVVLCDPNGATSTYGWEAYRGVERIGGNTGLADKDLALIHCVKCMLGVGQ